MPHSLQVKERSERGAGAGGPVHVATVVKRPMSIFGAFEADGGFVAESLDECVITEGVTWEGLRRNAREAVETYYFDSVPPKRIRLHLVRDEAFSTR